MIRTGKKFSKPEMSRVINGDVKLAEEVEKPEKVRLDILMGECYKSYNRSSLQKFIEFGFVTVDGEIAKKPNQKFERGVKIDLKVPNMIKNADLIPEVIYEDGNVVVVQHLLVTLENQLEEILLLMPPLLDFILKKENGNREFAKFMIHL